ncbi:MAG: tetratricopeptide repeat protein [Armatimonadota bacterium]|nr:tetratricopeptide repeat protein [Armatimonadota bacterium]
MVENSQAGSSVSVKSGRVIAWGKPAICALLALVTLAIYLPVVNFGLVNLDDHFYVTKNPHVRSGLSIANVAWAFRTFTESNWHPLTWVSLQLDCTLDRSGARLLHLTNVILHIANTLLLFILLEAATGSRLPSAVVAALFAVHPLHVESVAWVSERKDVLSTFFWMLSMLAYLRWARNPSLAGYGALLVAYILGLLSKPMLVSLPIILLLFDLWPLARIRFGSSESRRLMPFVIEKLPLFALACASCVITYVAQLQGGAVGRLDYYPIGVRLANAVVSYTAYLWKAMWPARLAAFYPHPEDTLPTWQVTASAVLLAVVSGAALRSVYKRPYIAVGWFWYLVTLVPVIGIVQVGLQGMADRYTYVPLIGIFIVAAWGVSELVGRIALRPIGRAVAWITVGVICAFAVLAHRQVKYWRNDFTLFGHAIRVTQRNAVAHTHLGLAYERMGNIEKALEQFRAAVDANPRYSPAYTCLGAVLMRQGKLDEALAYFTRAVSLSPGVAEAHYNLGLALLKKREYAAAAQAFRQAIKIRSDYADAYNDLALALAHIGNLKEAVESAETAVNLSPRTVRFRRTLALLLSQAGDLNGAVSQYRIVVRFRPADAVSRFELGRLLLSLGDSNEAARQFASVLKLRPDLAEAHLNLALALYDRGRYAEAWSHVREAQKRGIKPHPGFLAALRAKMPEPAGGD